MEERDYDEESRLWKQYKLGFQDYRERERWHLQFCLNTSPNFFVVWLKDKLEEEIDEFPGYTAGLGELCLWSIAVTARDSITWLSLLVLYSVRDSVTKEYVLFPSPVGSVMFVKVVQLASERCQVEMGLRTPHLLGLYRALLTDISSCWPEAKLEPRWLVETTTQAMHKDSGTSGGSNKWASDIASSLFAHNVFWVPVDGLFPRLDDVPVRRPCRGGRPRHPEDEWAREQVRELGRDKREVFQEWKQRANPGRLGDLASPQETFRKLLHLSRKKPEENSQ